jgi:hypothetical protein
MAAEIVVAVTAVETVVAAMAVEIAADSTATINSLN